MAPDADPYRTLGLTRDATLDEVRRAYRRLAKANHPDAAGEAALPRFLAIQAAYDTIAGPDSGRRRPGAAPAGAPAASLGSRSRPRRCHVPGLRRPAAPGASDRWGGSGARTAPGPAWERPPAGRTGYAAAADPSDRRTRRRWARRPTTVPTPSRSSPTGVGRRGTGRRRGRTGRSIRRSTPIRASTDRSTRHAPAGSCTGAMRRDRPGRTAVGPLRPRRRASRRAGGDERR